MQSTAVTLGTPTRPRKQLQYGEYWTTPRDIPTGLTTRFTPEDCLLLWNKSVERTIHVGKGGQQISPHDAAYYGRNVHTGHAWPIPCGFRPGVQLSPPPLCGHGTVPTLYYTTATPGQKGGRPFLRCPKGRDDPDDCKYFYWVDQIPPIDPLLTPNPSRPPPQPTEYPPTASATARAAAPEVLE